MEIGGRDIFHPHGDGVLPWFGAGSRGLPADFTPRSCLRGHGVLGTLVARPQMGRRGRRRSMRAGHERSQDAVPKSVRERHARRKAPTHTCLRPRPDWDAPWLRARGHGAPRFGAACLEHWRGGRRWTSGTSPGGGAWRPAAGGGRIGVRSSGSGAGREWGRCCREREFKARCWTGSSRGRAASAARSGFRTTPAPTANAPWRRCFFARSARAAPLPSPWTPRAARRRPAVPRPRRARRASNNHLPSIGWSHHGPSHHRSAASSIA